MVIKRSLHSIDQPLAIMSLALCMTKAFARLPELLLIIFGDFVGCTITLGDIGKELLELGFLVRSFRDGWLWAEVENRVRQTLLNRITDHEIIQNHLSSNISTIGWPQAVLQERLSILDCALLCFAFRLAFCRLLGLLLLGLLRLGMLLGAFSFEVLGNLGMLRLCIRGPSALEIGLAM